MIYIFGYGSLICPAGINGRGMSRIYTNKDLQLTTLIGFRREWNTIYYGNKYLGIVPNFDICSLQCNEVNGVIFPISRKDLEPFKESEGINEIPPVYTLTNVTSCITTKLLIHDRILTCVTNNPSYNGTIPPHYFPIIEEGFKLWGLQFKQQFENTTFPQNSKQGTN
jgi:hypothetical protein